MSEISKNCSNKITSDVNKIISLFLERGKFYITDAISVVDSDTLRFLDVTGIRIEGSNIYLRVEGDEERVFPITSRYGSKIVKLIRVHYDPNTNSYPIVFYNSVYNIKQLCNPDIYPKEEIVEYFVRFFDFSIDKVDEPLKSIECSKFEYDNYDSFEGDRLVVIYIGVDDIMDTDRVSFVPASSVTFEFDRFGKLTSHVCSFDADRELIIFNTVPVETEDDEDIANIEEIFDDILNALKSLQTSITNLSNEVHDKLAEFNMLKKSSDD